MTIRWNLSCQPCRKNHLYTNFVAQWAPRPCYKAEGFDPLPHQVQAHLSQRMLWRARLPVGQLPKSWMVRIIRGWGRPSPCPKAKTDGCWCPRLCRVAVVIVVAQLLFQINESPCFAGPFQGPQPLCHHSAWKAAAEYCKVGHSSRT